MVIGVILYNKKIIEICPVKLVFFLIMNTVPFFDTILASDSLTVAANKRYIKEMETVTHTMKAGNTSK